MENSVNIPEYLDDECAAGWAAMKFGMRNPTKCPLIDCAHLFRNLSNLVVHLNDSHKFTFIDIANVLERDGINAPI